MASPDIDALLGQMTLDEKISILAGQNMWETVAVERLHIPYLKVTDGPNGARGATFLEGTSAACFPACVSLASTFDRELSRRIGKALGEEAQTKGAYVLLGPTVCCHRSPLGGRNFEAFSEDPLLSGLMAAEYVKGLQSERVAATVKHYLANEQDTRRFTVDEKISQRALREIYLKAFEIVVKESDPWCFMTSYPKVNGSHVDETSEFLIDILRNEWGYRGLTMSDWGASATVEGIKNGLDLEMPGPPNRRKLPEVHQALKDGRVSESDINDRARNILKLLEKTGKFSDRKITPEEQAIDKPEHRALIREAGGAGIVLLKNDNNILPINTNSTKKIALLGPLAKQAAAHGGGSASLKSHYRISPFEAFSERLGSDVEITYSKGAHIFRSYPDLVVGTTSPRGKPGFLVEYFNNTSAIGKPFAIDDVPISYFTTHDKLDIKAKALSARFSTSYCPSEDGNHYLSLSGAGPTRLYIDHVFIAQQPSDIRDAMAFIAGVQDEVRFQHFFSANKTYDISIETFMPTGSVSDIYLLDQQLCVHLGFVAQAEMEADLRAEAASLAQDADLALVFVGNTSQWESEGQDLDAMTLPPYDTRDQDALISTVAAANSRTVVINTTGVAVELPWINDVEGFMQVWYPGQEVGNSIVDVLLGMVNPSGRLPFTWPRRYEDVPCYGHFGLDSYESREVEYKEGVFVGYRHFDRCWGSEREALFPFGFGLSYTSFSIKEAVVSESLRSGADNKVLVTMKVTNTGERDGAQVVQVYLAPPQTDLLERPVKQLAGFEKVALNVGEEKIVQVSFGRDAAAYWDESNAEWVVAPGKYEVLVATSSKPQDVSAKISLNVVDGFRY